MTREEWLEKYGGELEDIYLRFRQKFSHLPEEITQQAALMTLRYLPSEGPAAYFNRVFYLYTMSGYHDGKRWTGTGNAHRDRDIREVLGMPIGDNDARDRHHDRVTQRLSETVLIYLKGHTPSPEAQVIARDLLEKADPRLLKAAYKADLEGEMHEYPGFTRTSISNHRKAFFERIGEPPRQIQRGRGWSSRSKRRKHGAHQ